MFKKPVKISRLIFLNQFLLVSVILSVVFVLWIVDEYQIYRTFAQKQYDRELEKNKERLKEQMRNIINYIDVARQMTNNDSLVKEYVLNALARYRIEASGYVFINREDGKALIFNGKRAFNKSVAGLKDEKGHDLHKMELACYKKPGGDFMTYYFRKMDDTVQHKKIAFVKAYPDFKWILGVGNYVADINNDVTDFLMFFEKSMENKIKIIIFLFLGILVILYISSKLISRSVMKPVERGWKYIVKRMDGKPEENNAFDYIILKEVKMIFENIDELISKKIELEKQLKKYSEELEGTIEKRTVEIKAQAKNLEMKNEELEKMNEIFVNREFRIKELRDKIARLEDEIDLLKQKNIKH